MSDIAFIGLGAMGRRMAHRLLQTGHGLVCWNRSTAATEELTRLGATAADSPAHAAALAEVVITMVTDPAALREVSEGPHGIAAGVPVGATVIDMSTVGPTAVRRLASLLGEPLRLLDAPVLGSLSEAESGTLRVFVGGPSRLVEQSRDVLSVFGEVLHVGPSGAGAAAKLVANSTLFAALGALGEALSLAEALGLKRDTAFDILSSTPLAGQAERRRPAIDSGEYPTRFRLSLARKDAELVVEAATETGADVRMARAASEWLTQAELAGFGDHDYSAVLKYMLNLAPRP